jgi:hypothetical protein
MVAEPERRAPAPATLSAAALEPTLELVVIVGIEQVVLAVVLVVQHHLHLPQTLLQAVAVGHGRARRLWPPSPSLS